MAPLRTNWTLAIFRRNLENVESRDEILFFLEQLMGERDELLKRQDHLQSLTQLAEMKVSDADQLAGRIEKEAQGQARDILARADEQARHALEETKARALSEVQEEIRTIRSVAEKEFEAVVREQTVRLRVQVKQFAEHFFDQMLIEAQEGKRQLDLLQADLEDNLSSFGLPGSVPDEEKGTGESSAAS